MVQARCSVLVVDDDALCRRAFEAPLRNIDCDLRIAGSQAEARALLEERPADIAFIDFNLDEGTGADLLRWARPRGLVRAAFCVTGAPTCRNVVDAMQAGFIDVVEKPANIQRLRSLVAAHRPRPASQFEAWRQRYAPEIIGDDPALLETLKIVEGVADTDCGVLISGESGTGKELIARAIHRSSPRADQPFVALNCAAIPESLIEAELFGHTRGAFTGAVGARGGHIAAAHGGTLFLDEIGDLPLSAQAKLLRVLQERTVTPVGSDRAQPIDVRVIAATHRDLETMVEAGAFRADLFFRLYVVRAHLPSLRERPGDILALARHYLAEAAARTRRPVEGFDESAQDALVRHPWPGNVRELTNAIERAVLLRREGMVGAADLRLGKRISGPMAVVARVAVVPNPASVAAVNPATPAAAPAPRAANPTSADGNLNLRDALDDVERNLIKQALDRSGGNRSEAATLLGLNRTTLSEKLKRMAL
jgi:two-component system response regulator HydG